MELSGCASTKTGLLLRQKGGPLQKPFRRERAPPETQLPGSRAPPESPGRVRTQSWEPTGPRGPDHVHHRETCTQQEQLRRRGSPGPGCSLPGSGKPHTTPRCCDPTQSHRVTQDRLHDESQSRPALPQASQWAQP